MPPCGGRGQSTNVSQEEKKKSDVKSVGVWGCSARWGQFVPLMAIQNFSTPKVVK